MGDPALLPLPSLFRRNLAAISFGVAGWTAFAFADTLSKWLAQDYPVSQVIGLTAIVTFIMALCWTIGRYGYKSLITPFFGWHAARSLCAAGTTFCVVHAVSRIPLADFYGIIFLTPLMLAVLSFFLLGEKIGWHRLLAILVGFGGVVILAGPQFGTYNAGILFAFAAVIFVCGNGLVVRKMRAETVLPLYALYPALLNMVIHCPLMLPDFRMPEAVDISLFAAVGPLILIGIMGFSLGFARASETAVVAPFSYIQIVWGVLLGYLLFGDVPQTNTIIGAAIIISSGLYVIWREHRLHITH